MHSTRNPRAPASGTVSGTASVTESAHRWERASATSSALSWARASAIASAILLAIASALALVHALVQMLDTALIHNFAFQTCPCIESTMILVIVIARHHLHTSRCI